MNKYELTVVVSANVEEEVKVGIIEQVKELITRFGGTITNIDDCGKKRLAYEIQKIKDGFYYFIKFDAESNCPAEVESRIRIMENVLRFLCVKDEE
jgi:small subunit ribosomal protein S6